MTKPNKELNEVQAALLGVLQDISGTLSKVPDRMEKVSENLNKLNKKLNDKLNEVDAYGEMNAAKDKGKNKERKLSVSSKDVAIMKKLAEQITADIEPYLKTNEGIKSALKGLGQLKENVESKAFKPK